MYKTLPLSSYNFKIDLKENNYIILINMKFILTIYKFAINGVIYIGSTWDFHRRIIEHKRYCYDEKNRDYNYQVYKYIRENNIDWNNIIIENIYTQELDERNDLLRRQTEQKYIDEYDSKNNGLNTYNAYITEEEKKEYTKEYTKKHKEKIKEYQEKHKKKIKEYQKEYREKHKKKIKEDNKEYREKHKEELKEKKKEYRDKHKERIKEKNRIYREHKKNVKICNEIVNELIDSLF